MRKIFLYAGLALATLAIFAQSIGIDNDVGWGGGRKIMLTAGLSLTLACLLLAAFQKKLTLLGEFITDRLHFDYSAQTIFISSIAACIVIATYIWFSQSTIKDLKGNYNYYSELAIGFKAGHLYLPEKPSSALLSFSDPYNYSLRKEHNLEDFPWDVSLYNKKFYVYWGPAPSLLLTLFGKEQLARIGDHYLALLFACGLFLYSSLIILKCCSTSSKHTSSWLVGGILLVIGLVTPVTIMLKEARVYEVAIFGCQFFFIGGCYWIYSTIEKKELSLWKLAFAGIHWAFALGTRITIAPVILFSAVVTSIYILRMVGTFNSKLYLFPLAALGIPIVLAASGLGWYNWARFGSVFEFGMKYQLTNVDYRVFKDSFSLRYVTGNLYNYFLHPVKLLPRFPYIMRVEYPASNDRLGGLLYLSPYVFLIFAPMLRMINNFRRKDNVPKEQKAQDPSGNWLVTILSGSAFIGMLIILTFYFVAMRYIEDFMPSLILLVTIQLIQWGRLLNQNNIVKNTLKLTTTIFTLLTVAANFVIAIPNSGKIYMIELLNSISKLPWLQ